MPFYHQNQAYKIIAVIGFFALAMIFFIACKTSYLKKSAGIDERQSGIFDTLTNHAKTLKKAIPENIRGDFENENSLEYLGVKAQMSKENNEFFASFRQNNQTEKYQITAISSSNRIEEYITEIGGELRRLPIAYDLRLKCWINLNAAYFERDGANFFRHQTNWKTVCASCHLDFSGQPKDSQTLSLMAAAPGSVKAFETERTPLTELNSDVVMLACGQCHAKDLTAVMPKLNKFNAGQETPGEVISAHRKAVQDPSHFFADGSVRLSSHEYQGILRSVCYLKSKAGGTGLAGEKINCLSCHTANNGSFDVKTDERLHTNQTCTQCHGQFETAEDLAEHTKHSGVPEANNCTACHMPEVVYGHLSFQKTHEINIPNPELTISKQVPNACNQCHTDKSVNWAIMQSKNLWPEHFRDAKISTGDQFNQPEGIRGLFAGDAFMRAWSANNLAKHSDLNWSTSFLTGAFETEGYPLVRYFLANSLRAADENPPAFDFMTPNNIKNHSAGQTLNKNLKLIENLKRKRPSPDIEIGE